MNIVTQIFLYKHVNKLHAFLELTIIIIKLIVLFFITFVYSQTPATSL